MSFVRRRSVCACVPASPASRVPRFGEWHVARGTRLMTKRATMDGYRRWLVAALLLSHSDGLLVGSPISCRRGRSSPIRCDGQQPSFWDKMLYGQQGKPAAAPKPCASDGCTIRDLRPVFDQWDRDQNGSLDLKELQRGFLVAGIEPSDWDSAFRKLDADGDEVRLHGISTPRFAHSTPLASLLTSHPGPAAPELRRIRRQPEPRAARDD